MYVSIQTAEKISAMPQSLSSTMSLNWIGSLKIRRGEDHRLPEPPVLPNEQDNLHLFDYRSEISDAIGIF